MPQTTLTLAFDNSQKKTTTCALCSQPLTNGATKPKPTSQIASLFEQVQKLEQKRPARARFILDVVTHLLADTPP
jgi:hypothetical protein